VPPRLGFALDNLPVYVHLLQRLSHCIEQGLRGFDVVTLSLKLAKQR
jgi:hypothetical protein